MNAGVTQSLELEEIKEGKSSLFKNAEDNQDDSKPSALSSLQAMSTPLRPIIDSQPVDDLSPRFGKIILSGGGTFVC